MLGSPEPLSAARITRTSDVRWRATAPTRGKPGAARRLLAGIARRAIRPSAFCRTVWRHGCRAPEGLERSAGAVNAAVSISREQSARMRPAVRVPLRRPVAPCRARRSASPRHTDRPGQHLMPFASDTSRRDWVGRPHVRTRAQSRADVECPVRARSLHLTDERKALPIG